MSVLFVSALPDWVIIHISHRGYSHSGILLYNNSFVLTNTSHNIYTSVDISFFIHGFSVCRIFVNVVYYLLTNNNLYPRMNILDTILGGDTSFVIK